MVGLPKKFSQRDSAMPPDVRKRSALPADRHNEFWGYASKPGRSPKFNIELAGRPEAFRTSDGTAVPLKKFLGKATMVVRDDVVIGFLRVNNVLNHFEFEHAV